MMLLGYIFHDAAGNPWESCFDDATSSRIWDSVGFSICHIYIIYIYIYYIDSKIL
jgi:hypothetical protein